MFIVNALLVSPKPRLGVAWPTRNPCRPEWGLRRFYLDSLAINMSLLRSWQMMLLRACAPTELAMTAIDT